jgi:hypothetical protein
MAWRYQVVGIQVHVILDNPLLEYMLLGHDRPISSTSHLSMAHKPFQLSANNIC